MSNSGPKHDTDAGKSEPDSPHQRLSSGDLVTLPFSTANPNGSGPASFQPRIGDVLADRFAIQRWLGGGGMGVVFEAWDRLNHRAIAIKTVRHLDGNSLFRFKQEFRQFATVRHRHLVKLYELFSHGEQCFFTMELIEGRDFLAYIRGDGAAASGHLTAGLSGPEESTDHSVAPDHLAVKAGKADQELNRRQNGLPDDAIRRLRLAIVQLAEAIAQIHASGLIHRDIKPSNVLVDQRGHVVLLDFGLAAVSDAAGTNAPTESVPVGTWPYMSPEQVGGQPLGTASDWYSLGVLLFESLTGQLPFRGSLAEVVAAKCHGDAPHPSELHAELPQDLADLSHRLLSRDPNRRPSQAEILSLFGLPDSSVPASDMTLSQAPPLVGREREIADLNAAFEQCLQKKTILVQVSGPSGMGKSAVVRSFLDQLPASPQRIVLTGRCYEQENLPFKAADGLIDSLSRHLNRLAPADVSALLPRDIGSLIDVFPVLGRVAAVANAPQQIHRSSDGHELRRRAFSALRELLARLGDRGTLVVFLDDLQWGDLDSVPLFSALLKASDPPPMMLIVSARSEDASSSLFLQAFSTLVDSCRDHLDVRELPIKPLDAAEAQRLATLLLENCPDREVIAAKVAREGLGSPFFVQELAIQAGKHWLPGKRERAVETSTLDLMLWERFEVLSTGARQLLEMVTVSGQPLLESVARRARTEVSMQVTLDELIQARLARVLKISPLQLPAIDTYHDRVREAILGRLTRNRIQQLHAELASLLEEGTDVDAERMARHCLGAGQPAKAGEYYTIAAKKAAASLAFDRAAFLFDRALELDRSAPRADLLEQMGESLANAGRGRDAGEALCAAAELNSGSKQIDLLCRASEQFLIAGYMDEGLETARRVVNNLHCHFPSSSRSALVSLLTARLRLRLRRLDPAKKAVAPHPLLVRQIDMAWSMGKGLSIVDPILGGVFVARSLLWSLQSGDRRRTARALAFEAAHCSAGGERARPRVRQLLDRSAELKSELDDPYLDAFWLLMRGAASFCFGDWYEARADVDEAETRLRKMCTGVSWELSTAQNFGTFSRHYLGNLAELALHSNRVADAASELGNMYVLASTLGFGKYLVSLGADEPARATQDLDEATRCWTAEGFHIQHMDVYGGQLLTDLYERRVTAAWQRVQETWPILRRSGLLHVDLFWAYNHFLRARAALAAAGRDRPDAALLRLARRDGGRLSRRKTPWIRGMGLLTLANVAIVERKTSVAVEQLTRAAALLGEAKMSLLQHAALVRLEEFVSAPTGNSSDALAVEWLQSTGVKSPEKLSRLFVADW